MKGGIPDPKRLLEVPSTAHTEPGEKRAASLLSGVGEPAALSPELLLRIKARVLSGPPRRVGTLRVKVLLAAALLIAVGGAALAAQGWRQTTHRTQAAVVRSGLARERIARPSSAESSALLAPTPISALETPPAPSAAGFAAAAPEVQETSGRARKSMRPPPDAAAALRESRMLTEALVNLRRDNDPRATLTLLDQYSQRFPNGSLALEATRARAEALVALGRRADALRTLDDLSPAALGRSMLLVRGELRAEQKRCADALGDLSSALSQNPHDSVDERALFGRASCRSRVGDAAGARSDLNLYAARFPNGRFQAQVTRLTEIAKPDGIF